jgi:Na+/H+ antiporter NhaA
MNVCYIKIVVLKVLYSHLLSFIHKRMHIIKVNVVITDNLYHVTKIKQYFFTLISIRVPPKSSPVVMTIVSASDNQWFPVPSRTAFGTMSGVSRS